MSLQHIPCGRANEGEILVRNYLMTELEDTDGFLVTNYHYPFYNASREHDLILINWQGVWAIEVKNWHSPIKADRNKWLRTSDNHCIDSPITSIETKAKYLATSLENAGFTNVSVVGMVVLSQSEEVAPIEFDDEPRQYTQVFRLQPRLINALLGRGLVNYRFHPDNMFLTPHLMQRIATMLARRSVDPQGRIIGDYRLLEELEAGEMFRAYKAMHRVIPNRYARVKKYQMPSITSSQELRAAANRFMHDMIALQNLKDHPHIVRVENYVIDPDSEDIHWMITEWIDGETLQDKLSKKISFSLAEQLHILRAVADALVHAHEKNILHRNLTPSSIYIGDADDIVKLGDFDYARVPARDMTVSSEGKPMIVNMYTAPELRWNARDATERSDLYALGAIWYDMAIGLTPDEGILFYRIKEAALPDEAITLLSKLVEPLRRNRPKSAKAVEQRLQRL